VGLQPIEKKELSWGITRKSSAILAESKYWKSQERPSRKGELIALIEQYLAGEQLRALWEQLDETQQLAVAETIHYEHGVFNAHRFRAKYGALPVFGTKKDSWGYGEMPSLLR
jgi:hypothetical protein